MFIWRIYIYSKQCQQRKQKANAKPTTKMSKENNIPPDFELGHDEEPKTASLNKEQTLTSKLIAFNCPVSSCSRD